MKARRTLQVRATLCALLALLLCAPGLRAIASEVEPALERRVKAAFLYQFIPYVEWPAQALGLPDAPFVIAIAGSDETVAEVGAVIGDRTVRDRPVVVRRWREGDLGGGVHVVYVRGQHPRLAAIARAAQATGTLVVTETDTGLAQGGMINFQLVDGKVRFDIALSPSEKAGLRISSRLLSVAREVRLQP